MLNNLTGWHALIILAILLLVFGSAKLPALAKGVGQSMRILKNEARDATTESQRESVPANAFDAQATNVPTSTMTPVPYRHVS